MPLNFHFYRGHGFENCLAWKRDLKRFCGGMPAEPLGFVRDVMLNSGGFFVPKYRGVKGRVLRHELFQAGDNV